MKFTIERIENGWIIDRDGKREYVDSLFQVITFLVFQAQDCGIASRSSSGVRAPGMEDGALLRFYDINNKLKGIQVGDCEKLKAQFDPAGEPPQPPEKYGMYVNPEKESEFQWRGQGMRTGTPIVFRNPPFVEKWFARMSNASFLTDMMAKHKDINVQQTFSLLKDLMKLD